MYPLSFILCFAIAITNNKYREIPFQNNLSATSPVYNSLGVKDSNALIFSVSKNSHWHKTLTTHYLVFYPNGKVHKITLERSKNENSISNLSKEKVRSRERIKYTQWLDSCISNNLFELNQSLLNTTKKPSKVSGKTTRLSVSDGLHYNFSIFLNKRTLHYSAYAPKAYIEGDFPGKVDRLKFLEVIESFNKIYND